MCVLNVDLSMWMQCVWGPAEGTGRILESHLSEDASDTLQEKQSVLLIPESSLQPHTTQILTTLHFICERDISALAPRLPQSPPLPAVAKVGL